MGAEGVGEGEVSGWGAVGEGDAEKRGEGRHGWEGLVESTRVLIMSLRCLYRGG